MIISAFAADCNDFSQLLPCFSQLFCLQHPFQDPDRRLFQTDAVGSRAFIAPEHAAVAAVEQPCAQKRTVFREPLAGDGAVRQLCRAAAVCRDLKRKAVHVAQRGLGNGNGLRQALCVQRSRSIGPCARGQRRGHSAADNRVLRPFFREPRLLRRTHHARIRPQPELNAELRHFKAHRASDSPDDLLVKRAGQLRRRGEDGRALPPDDLAGFFIGNIAQQAQSLRAARDQADGLRDQVTQQRLQFAEMEHSIETLRRDKARWAEESAALQGTLNALREKIAAQRQQAQEAEGQLAQLRQAVQQQAEAARQADADTDQLEQKRQAQLAHQRELVEESERLHERHTQDGDQLHRTEILYDRADNEQKTLSEHMWNTYEATLATAEEFRLPPGEFALTSGERDANGLRREIRELGPINAHAVEEYAQTKERFDDLSRQKEDMTKAESDLRGLIKRLLSQMEKQFVTEFDRLNGYFQQTFVRLFGGGQAELKLTDPNDPLSCGIEVVAQPPGKKLQLLSLLSGGERALTAIAILFAMLKVKPSPFCILDEIEAALDDANISYFADYLVEFAKTTQFVVVTHRKGTMERCDSLYGVAMEEKGVSSMVSVNLENYH